MENNFPIITSEQMATVDAMAVEHGLSITQMMEYAGLNIARFAQRSKPDKILILVGKGHNGGDGLAAARHLKNWGYKVRIFLAEAPDSLKPISKNHYDLLTKMEIPMELWSGTDEQKSHFQHADLIIDALLGYNINGDPRENYAELISAANNSQKEIHAIDLPSGLNGSTGGPKGVKAFTPCIKAKQTLTLALPKIGITEPSAQQYVGEIFVADLGIPEFIYKKSNLDVPKGLFKNSSIVKLP